jgi:hypothetical protein
MGYVSAAGVDRRNENIRCESIPHRFSKLLGCCAVGRHTSISSRRYCRRRAGGGLAVRRFDATLFLANETVLAVEVGVAADAVAGDTIPFDAH